jgi:3-isopropylmalate dehydrogenase
MHIALLPGDGIGPEVIVEAVRVLEALELGLRFEEALVGGAAYKAAGHPLPAATLDLARRADAVLFGAVGDPTCDALERHLRPEQAILGLRRELGLFANLRPARIFPELLDASALRPEIAAAIDLVIVRELTGDVYFGTPRGRRQTETGLREGYDTMRYNEEEVARIARRGFEAARQRRRRRLCSVDKANVLETSQLWRDVTIEVSAEYPDVALEHMYVDNAAMQLVRNPGAFDVIVTGNLFGDILSDQASMCVGSIGMMASASLDAAGKGLYEPIHGSAPDIAGQGKANPLATILSAAMMLRYSLGLGEAADRIEAAVAAALAGGARTGDLGGTLGTRAMGDRPRSRQRRGHEASYRSRPQHHCQMAAGHSGRPWRHRALGMGRDVRSALPDLGLCL